MTTQTALARAIKAAEGQSALARLIGRSQAHIHYWLKLSKEGVPAQAAIDIETALKGKVTRHELRPDIFGEKPGAQPKASREGAAV